MQVPNYFAKNNIESERVVLTNKSLTGLAARIEFIPCLGPIFNPEKVKTYLFHKLKLV